ncbi:hypothetical protein EZV62_024659 [Acer yangbiense]|uniref:Retrotransposon Copia-like N-terminal domain-containing protein n=1 Tax=Acer yangbiense TaxID=1000413 RepID=A0A5C7GVF8_9ROSI|nr:hypothetical protein EZV62_024659 [Acer yangbiense]
MVPPVSFALEPTAIPYGVKLNGMNFSLWLQVVETFVTGRGKLGYLTGRTQAPSLEGALYEKWSMDNAIVKRNGYLDWWDSFTERKSREGRDRRNKKECDKKDGGNAVVMVSPSHSPSTLVYNAENCPTVDSAIYGPSPDPLDVTLSISKYGCAAVEVVAMCSDDGDAKPTSLGGVSGGGAEILGLGEATVEVVAVVRR